MDNSEYIELTRLSLDTDSRPMGDCANFPFPTNNTERIVPYRHPSMHDRGIGMHCMKPDFYRAITSGNMAFFQERAFEDLESSSLLQNRSPKGDSVLHIAAHSGRDEIVQLILSRHARLLLQYVNLVGNTALHEAVSAGHLSTAKILVSSARQILDQLQGSTSSAASTSSDNAPNIEALLFVNKLLRHQNGEGDTALHLALRNHSEDMANFLFEAEPMVTHFKNRQGKTPLHMAAEVGYMALFEPMMKISVGNDLQEDVLQYYRYRIVLAAIKVNDRSGIFKLMLRDWKNVFHAIFVNEQYYPHPISHAAATGYLDGVRDMLNLGIYFSYISNVMGFFPIHLASSNGHIEIIQEFLQHCPDSRELLNDDSQNILHLAAMNGKSKVVSYILENPHLEMLINARDCQGNTPLHLATGQGHAKVVSILTWDSRVDLGVVNGAGMTATDVALSSWEESQPTLRERLTWLALRNAGAPQAHQHQDTSNIGMDFQYSRQSYWGAEAFKDRVNTLILVATLIVTVTFAAGLTLPGGGSDSDKDEGKTTWIQKCMFDIFVISNTMAMYSSITVVVALIWAQLGDRGLVLTALKYTVVVLGISLAMVSMAFMTGAYIAVSDNIWLSNSVLVIGFIGFLAVFVLYIPLYSPTSLKHRIARHIFYYPFYLMLKVMKVEGSQQRNLPTTLLATR